MSQKKQKMPKDEELDELAKAKLTPPIRFNPTVDYDAYEEEQRKNMKKERKNAKKDKKSNR